MDSEEETALKTLVESPRNSSDSKGPPRAQTPPKQPAISRASSLANRSSTLGSTSKKRQSIISGNGPPNGRLSKTVGDLYLLAGRLSDATFW
jgi:trafficking protein particle complex subunit 9